MKRLTLLFAKPVIGGDLDVIRTTASKTVEGISVDLIGVATISASGMRISALKLSSASTSPAFWDETSDQDWMGKNG